MTGLLGPQTRRAWMEVIALLVEAADRGAADASDDPAIHSLAVGAQIVASRAIGLLPVEFDDELDGIDIAASLAAAPTVPTLIRAAEQAARRHPIEHLPVGACGVIVALGDLVHESAA